MKKKLRKLTDKQAHKMLNRFSDLTPEERERVEVWLFGDNWEEEVRQQIENEGGKTNENK